MEKYSLNSTTSLIVNPKFPNCNSLLIEDEKTALVDAGLSGDHIKTILKEIKIDILINSHTHPDHVAANYMISETTSAIIYVPEQEKGNTLSLKAMEKSFGVLGQAVEPSWEKIVVDLIGFKASGRETTYGDGHIFDLGENQMEGIHTPGHSAGHNCFLFRGKDIFFASDLGIDSFGPWYGYLDSNLNDYIKSINKIKKFDIKRTISSHENDYIYNIGERLNKSLDIINQRRTKIIELLKEGPKDINQLIQSNIIYFNLDKFSSPMLDFLLFFEGNMIKEHLKNLIESGEISEKKGLYHY